MQFVIEVANISPLAASYIPTACECTRAGGHTLAEKPYDSILPRQREASAGDDTPAPVKADPHARTLNKG